MTKQAVQIASVVTALCAAVAAQLPLLKGVLPEQVLTVVLVATNILSAWLPSLLPKKE